MLSVVVIGCPIIPAMRTQHTYTGAPIIGANHGRLIGQELAFR